MKITVHEYIENPKKRSMNSGTNYFCTKCIQKSDPILDSNADAIKHYEETKHAILISSWFNSIYGTINDYDEAVYGDDNQL